MNKIVRNDDVAYDSSVRALKEFCVICDECCLEVIQGITLRGRISVIHNPMSNDQIVKAPDSEKWFYENKELLELLQNRGDKIAVHGMWHTHCPTEEEVQESISVLTGLGLKPTYFVPPFNDGEYGAEVCGLTLCQHCELIESFIDKKTIPDESETTVYLHSRRFEKDMKRLKNLLMRFSIGDSGYEIPLERSSYPKRNPIVDFIERRITGKWLDIGCNTGVMLSEVPNGVGIDSSIQMVVLAKKKDLEVYHGNVYHLPFSDKVFDTVVLSGVLFQCRDWKSALKEALRVGKKVIGYNAYPGKSQWGVVGGSNGWTKSVIDPVIFPYTEQLDSLNYYWEIE